MVRIRLEHIDKVFGKKGREFKALDDISFEIEDNSFFGILGASGAGKTTIMRIIAGLETPTRGAIYFNDQVAASDGKDIIPVEDRNVGMVFQNWALYPHMTNYENIAFPLKSKHWSPEDIHRRITELARVLEISETLEKRPGEISGGGQQQRVAWPGHWQRTPRSCSWTSHSATWTPTGGTTPGALSGGCRRSTGSQR